MAKLIPDYDMRRISSKKDLSCPYRKREKNLGCLHDIYIGFRVAKSTVYVKTIHKCHLIKRQRITYVNIKGVEKPQSLRCWGGIRKWVELHHG